MYARECNAKPDEGEERIRQPVHPGNTLFLEAIAEIQIEPNVQELVWTDAWNPIGLESSGSKAPL
jgi:hypothetical protein